MARKQEPQWPPWDAETVRRLRQELGLTQQELAEELGVRQQTVSEWETGAYRPRGASVKLLRIVAERSAQADYGKPRPGARPGEPPPETGGPGEAETP